MTTKLIDASTGNDRPTVLAVDDDRIMRAVIDRVLSRAGVEVVAVDVDEALDLIEHVEFDLVVCDRTMPGVSGQEFLEVVRSDPRFDLTPFLFLTVSDEMDDLVLGFDAGADDYITKPFQPAELIARVTSRLERSAQARRRSKDLLDIDTFEFQVERELLRARSGGPSGVLAVINIPSLKAVEESLGEMSRRRVLENIAVVLGQSASELDIVGATRHGDLAILMPATDVRTAADRLREMSSRAAAMVTQAKGLSIRPVPMIGFVEFESNRVDTASQVSARAVQAADEAQGTQDLQPRRWIPADEVEANKQDHKGGRESVQVVATFLLGLFIPFLVYTALWMNGIDISWPVYIAVVIVLVTTAALIWMEGVYAGRHPGAPLVAGAPEPPASAIICAYMPNEAATIVETIEHFLTVDYPAGLQIVLAYNTPDYHPVEAELQVIAQQNPNLLLLKVENSNSKAQNLNAALARTTGEFIGVFDADHQPDPDSFHRAWRWLSNGYDVVQGHCLVRNPEETFLARMVAIEFETIYSVSHPGRWLRDGFGVFGGSNGYWKTEALHMTRMRGSMLTEDIDASMRVLEAGGQIASDPWLISRELATTTARQIWNQRLRWAQGWTQVSLRHLLSMMRLPHFTFRQKFGVFMLLFQREIYPWVSTQIFPLLAFWWLRGDLLHWAVPIFLAATIFTMTVGPGTVFITYRQAHPSVKRKWWFLQYGIFSTFLYTEAKNIIARVAHLKELLGESSWRVTPRSADPASASLPASIGAELFDSDSAAVDAESDDVLLVRASVKQPRRKSAADMLADVRQTTGSCLWCGETRSLTAAACPRCGNGWIDQTLEEAHFGPAIDITPRLPVAEGLDEDSKKRLVVLGAAVIAAALFATFSFDAEPARSRPAGTPPIAVGALANNTSLPPVTSSAAPTVAAAPPTTTAPTTMPPATVPPTSAPPTTVAPTTTTTLAPLPATSPVEVELLTLGAFALGPFDFGAAGESVAGSLVATLGQPDARHSADETWGLCPGQGGRVLQWGGLAAIFRQDAASEQFVGYRYDGTGDMRTISGLTLGLSLEEAQGLYPSSVVTSSTLQDGTAIYLLLRSSDKRTLLWGPTAGEAEAQIAGIYSYRPCDRGPFGQ